MAAVVNANMKKAQMQVNKGEHFMWFVDVVNAQIAVTGSCTGGTRMEDKRVLSAYYNRQEALSSVFSFFQYISTSEMILFYLFEQLISSLRTDIQLH